MNETGDSPLNDITGTTMETRLNSMSIKQGWKAVEREKIRNSSWK